MHEQAHKYRVEGNVMLPARQCMLDMERKWFLYIDTLEYSKLSLFLSSILQKALNHDSQDNEKKTENGKT